MVGDRARVRTRHGRLRIAPARRSRRCGTVRPPRQSRTGESRAAGRPARRWAAVRSAQSPVWWPPFCRRERPRGGVADGAIGGRPREDETSGRPSTRPELVLPRKGDGRRGDDRIGLVDELRQRVVEVARPRPQDVVRRRAPCRRAAASSMIGITRRRTGAGQQVVQVFDRARRACARRRAPANAARRRCPARDRSGRAGGRCGRACGRACRRARARRATAPRATSCLHDVESQRQVVVVARRFP